MGTTYQKLQAILTSKEAIRQAIINKGVEISPGTLLSNYPAKIADISSGSGINIEDIPLYSKAYNILKNANRLSTLNSSWEHMLVAKEILYEFELNSIAEAVNFGINNILFDVYTPLDNSFSALYNDCVNEVLIKNTNSYIINNHLLNYRGNLQSFLGFSTPIFVFGDFNSTSPENSEENHFLLLDGTSFGYASIILIRISFEMFMEYNLFMPIFNLKIQKGFGTLNSPVGETCLILPDGIEYVRSWAFQYSSYVGLVLPDSLTSTGISAFGQLNDNVCQVMVPKIAANFFQPSVDGSKANIGQSSFDRYLINDAQILFTEDTEIIPDYLCATWENNTKYLHIPSSVTTIGANAFSDWKANNTPLKLPANVSTIKTRAFTNWESNNYPLIIPTTLSVISESCFSGWLSNTHQLIIPDNITEIEMFAFKDWTVNNKQLILSATLQSIGGSAFEGWVNNTYPIIIPSSVQMIEDAVFKNWSLVPYIQIDAINPPELMTEDAFEGQNNAPIYVPDASVAAYKEAMSWDMLADRIFGISTKA